MTTNKPEVFRVLGHRLLDDGPVERLPYNWIRVIRLSDYEALQAECEKLREQLESVKELLKDPVTVFVNMKRGIIAKPSLRDLIDLHGDVPNGEDVQLLEITKHRSESERLRKLVEECADYLDHNEHTCIHNGSALHRKLADATMQATMPSDSTS